MCWSLGIGPTWDWAQIYSKAFGIGPTRYGAETLLEKPFGTSLTREGAEIFRKLFCIGCYSQWPHKGWGGGTLASWYSTRTECVCMPIIWQRSHSKCADQWWPKHEVIVPWLNCDQHKARSDCTADELWSAQSMVYPIQDHGGRHTASGCSHANLLYYSKGGTCAPPKCTLACAQRSRMAICAI